MTTQKLTHEDAIRQAFSTFHESWMTQEDRDKFDAVMLERYGAQLDRDLSIGLANGYAISEQIDLALATIISQGDTP